jgi:hypothetical protein
MPRERDFLAEVRAEVGDYLDTHGSVVSSMAAAELIESWEGDGLLEGWLLARSNAILTEYITTTSRTRGACRPREERQAAFAKFAQDFEDTMAADGLEAARQKAGEFFLFHQVTEDGQLVRKILGDLSADQVGEVRDNYRARAEDNRLKALVLEKVRERVAAAGPGATVGKIYTPQQLEKLFYKEGTS